MANSYLVDSAYSEIHAPKFYQKMCFATWGYKELATRCVKFTKSKKQVKEFHGVAIKPMERKKKRAIKKHFQNFLNHYNFGEQLHHYHISQINSYAHRAILSARKRMDAVYEARLTDPNDDTESDIEEIEL